MSPADAEVVAQRDRWAAQCGQLEERVADLLSRESAAIAALGPVWVHDGATLAEGIARKTARLEQLAHDVTFDPAHLKAALDAMLYTILDLRAERDELIVQGRGHARVDQVLADLRTAHEALARLVPPRADSGAT